MFRFSFPEEDLRKACKYANGLLILHTGDLIDFVSKLILSGRSVLWMKMMCFEMPEDVLTNSAKIVYNYKK